MSLISRSAFSRLAGVNRVQVTKLIETGTLVSGRAGMVDPKEPKNAAYLRRRGMAPVKDARAQKAEEPVALRKTESEVKRNEAATRKLDADLARILGLYVERRIVEAAFAAFGADWKTWILDLSRKIVPEIYGQAQRGGSMQEAIAYVDKELAASTKALKRRAEALKLGDIPA